MPLTPQLNDFLSCPICFNCFSLSRKPITLTCSHTCCSSCLKSLQCCPFDQTVINCNLPENEAIIGLIPNTSVSGHHHYHKERDASKDESYGIESDDLQYYYSSIDCIKQLALLLRPHQQQCSSLSRPMQRKLITLLHCQIVDGEGRARAMRNARSIGERALAEILIKHQDSHQLSSNLWAAVRARGCQFLGPAMQEEVLRLVLLALEDGSALSRKVLVMFVVQRLSPHFPHQASKTAIGHVIQLLYRASCFKLTKRDGDSSLMQLKEEYCSYEALRREHDTQIVSIALEAGLRISPDQWSSLLYGDTVHKSHMQSIIDKLQSPASFSQSIQELIIALQRTGDPSNLAPIKQPLEKLSLIDPTPANHDSSLFPTHQLLAESLESAKIVTFRLIDFLQKHAIPHNPHNNTSGTSRNARLINNPPPQSQRPRVGRVKPLIQSPNSSQQTQFAPVTVLASPTRGSIQRPCASVPPSRVIGLTMTQTLTHPSSINLCGNTAHLQNSNPNTIAVSVATAVPTILVGNGCTSSVSNDSNTPLQSPVNPTTAGPMSSLPSEDDQFIPFADQPFVSKYGPISRIMSLINAPTITMTSGNGLITPGMAQNGINNLTRTHPTNVILGRTAVPSLTLIQPLQQLVLTTTTILADPSAPQFGNATFMTDPQSYVTSSDHSHDSNLI